MRGFYAVTPIFFNTNTIIDHMEISWVSKDFPVSAVQTCGTKKRKICPQSMQIALHLNHYILCLSDLSSFSTHRIESLLVLRKWSNMTTLCRLISHSPFSSLSEHEVSSFFLGSGLCAGATIYHFSKFFQMGSPLESIYPIREKLEVCGGVEKNAEFHPFYLEKESLNQFPSSLRFLQASYKLARSKCKQRSYISATVLKNFKLRLVKRIPELKEGVKMFFKVEALIPQLKLCSDQDRAYILGIRYGDKSHALAVYPSAPYHFVDPMNGIGVAENVQNFLLFLANFLTEKYPNCTKFALLEFESLLPR